MSDILFSILVPVYNVRQYVEQCLDSLTCQEMDNFEVVIIDDGSTDDSGKICDTYQVKFPGIVRVVHQENKGLVLARRAAIKLARGQYFVFVDSDDFVESDLIKTLTKSQELYHPDLILYHADRYCNGEHLPFYNPLFSDTRLISFEEKAIYYEATLRHTVSNSIWGKAVRREIVDIDRDYSEFSGVTIGEDLLQSLPYITNAQSVLYVRDILYHYRTNPDSMAHDFKSNRYESMRTVEFELKKWSKSWKVDHLEELVSYHAVNETIWGCLRVLAKSDMALNSYEAKELINRMASDRQMKDFYKNLNKSTISPVKRITLFSLYSCRLFLGFILHIFRLEYRLKIMWHQKGNER